MRWQIQEREKKKITMTCGTVCVQKADRQRIKEQTGYDKKTIFKYLDEIVLPEKKHEPRPIHLVVDATYFGTRIDKTAWGVILVSRFRSKREYLVEIR